MQGTERTRDHITLQLEQVPVQHQSSLRKLCNPPGLLALFAAVVASVALFCCLSSPSSFAGSVFARKTALFLLSNAIFILLAADCRFTASATAAAAAASSKQEARCQSHHHQAEAEAAERCAVVPCVVIPCSASLEHSDQEVEEKQKPTMSAESRADEEQGDGDVAAVVSKLDELVVGHAAQEEDGVALELETLGAGEAACGGGGATAQELDRLEIHELNKKFDDFIQSRKTKWMEEEEEDDDDEEEAASLLLQHV